MISDHEVTNLEYRQFVNWAIDSLSTINGANTNKKENIVYAFVHDRGQMEEINIYPDTSVWITDYEYSYNEPMVSHYFQHEAYNNYPVVGISYDQANAYIHWLNSQFKLFLKKHHFQEDMGYFRMPTETEWQYAAASKTSGVGLNERNLYPWDNKLMDKDNTYKANYGPLIDKNNLYIKDPCDDGFCTTSPVKSFKENYFGLFDMAGNVSEWVSDTISASAIKKTMVYLLNCNIPDEIGVTFEKVSDKPLLYKILTKKKLDPATKKIIIDEFLTFAPDWNKISNIITDPFIFEKLQRIYENGSRDISIIKKYNRPGIIKGGSHHDSPVYMISSSTQVFPQSKSSSRTGFRVAMSIKEEIWGYLP